MFVNRWCMTWTVFLSVACLSAALSDDAKEFDIEKYRDELLKTSKREPACAVDENGLPRRVIINRNGVGFFGKPEAGAARFRTLALYDRLYLYVDDADGKGFVRVGADPFNDAPTGWVPSAFCLKWDNNEMLFLNGDSVPSEVNKVHVWKSEEEARDGNPDKAIYTEKIDRSKADVADLFFPVLKKDRTGALYQVGFLFGGDPGVRNEWGEKLDSQQRRDIAARIDTVNLVLVMDATGSMGPHIAEAKSRATEIVESLENKLTLATASPEQKPVKLTVNIGLVAYRDKGDVFETKVFVPLTNDRGRIKKEIDSLTAGGGGDEPEMVVEGVRTALAMAGLDRGALNRLVLIGDAPPHELDEGLLTELGKEVKAKYAQLDGVMCGSSLTAKRSFELIASASAGKVHEIKNAHAVIDQIIDDLKHRALGVPIEKKLVDDAVERKRTIAESSRLLGLTDRQARMMQKFLVARGADIGASGVDFKTGWVQVKPGTEGRFRVHVYMTRWKLAQALSNMLGLTDRISLKKDVAKNAPILIRSFLGMTGGDKSEAGIDKKGQSEAERGSNIPELTPGVKGGTKGAIEFSFQHRQKIIKLLSYWRNASLWEHEHVWIPVDLLP